MRSRNSALWLGLHSIWCLIPTTYGEPARVAFRQTPSFYHTEWSGVGTVFDIKQSADGYLWLTTSRGVLRFDGVQFQSVKEVTRGSVRDNEIDSVFFSASGGLWLTTESAGLLFWRDGKLTAFPDRRCTPTRKMGQVIEDRDGSLWVQNAAGLFHLRGAVCEQVGPNQGYPGGFAAGILLDGQGRLWVKPRVGPLLFLPPGQSRFQVTKLGAGPSTSYAHLHEAPNGGIWLSDDQGLRRVTGPGSEISPSGRKRRPPAQFGDFTFATDGSLWAVTVQGVQRYEGVTPAAEPLSMEAVGGEAFTPESGLSSDAVWKVLIDREGTVWVATNGGLDRLRGNPLSTLALPRSQEREYAVAAGDRGSVWTGNTSLPLTHVDVDRGVSSFPAITNILSVRRDHNGTVWASGTANLWENSGAGFSRVKYPDEALDSVVAMAADRHNDPWIVARSGRVYRYFQGEWSNQDRVLGRKPGVIGAMVDDAAGNIWLAFSDRVVKWDGIAYHAFVRRGRGVSETTMSVRGDHVWLGGSGGVQLLSNGEFRTMQWNDTAMPGRVSGLVESQSGDLWINGFSGITHVRADELRRWLRDPAFAVSAERFDDLDGLPGFSGEKLPEPSLAEGSDGRLWFATTRGIAWVDPAVLARSRNLLPPPIVISSVLANGKDYADSISPILPAHTENLEIDYTALSLSNPERVLFRYRLDGLDSNWREVGTRRQAFYTNLRPGNYRFRVMASNNSGVWNIAGASLNFSIDPAYYQTNWFRSLLVAAIVALLAGIYQLRLRYLTHQFNIRLEARGGERTRIARDLHDTLLQSFQGTLFKFHGLSYMLQDHPEAQKTLENCLEQARAAITEGRDAVLGLRSSTAITNDLARAISTFGERLAADQTDANCPEFRVQVEGKSRNVPPLVRDEVYHIACESLRNAFRHAQARRIGVELRYDPRHFQLRIVDNGKGIAPAVLSAGGRSGHHGLPGINERAELAGGRLSVWSQVDFGTEIELTIPASIAYPKSSIARQSMFSKKGAG